MITNPTTPINKIRIVPGESKQTKRIFHYGFLNDVDERREQSGKCSVVLISYDERAMRRKCTVELNNPWPHAAGNVRRGVNQIVLAIMNATTGSLDQRIIIGCEHV